MINKKLFPTTIKPIFMPLFGCLKGAKATQFATIIGNIKILN